MTMHENLLRTLKNASDSNRMKECKAVKVPIVTSRKEQTINRTDNAGIK